MKKEFLSQLKRDPKNLAALVIACVIMMAASFLAMKWQISVIQSITKKNAKTYAGIEELNKKLLTEQKGMEAVAAAAKEGKQKRIIGREEIHVLLNTISLLAKNNGVKILQITPPKEGSLKAAGGGKKKSAQSPVAFSQLVGMEIIGNYHQLGSFLQQLEQAESVLELEEITIRRTKTTVLSQLVSLTIKVYVK